MQEHHTSKAKTACYTHRTNNKMFSCPMIAYSILLLSSLILTVNGFSLNRFKNAKYILKSTSSSEEEDLELEALRAQIEAMVQPDLVSSESSPIIPASSTSLNKNNNVLVAASSVFIGIFSFFFLHNQPSSAIALLHAMEKDSQELERVLCNGKPTIVDFYADWCESCKVMAPSMRALELKYKNDINFVTIDGSSPYNSEYVRRFRVDGIPHVAFITPGAEVKTALVGAAPRKILEEDMEALLKNAALPYEGYDAFEEQSHILTRELDMCKLRSSS